MRLFRVDAQIRDRQRGELVVAAARELGVYLIDAALSGVGLLAAEQVNTTPTAVLLLVPLLAVLAYFAHERRQRLQGLLELGQAYRRDRARARRRCRS